VLVASAAESSLARADGVAGPALAAWYPTYNQDIQNVAVHGSLCLNDPPAMPADRQSLCEPPALETLGTGRYAVSIENGAPFPVIDNDSGFAAFVTTVGTNAKCFEEGTTFSGTTLQSLVHCVDPVSGADVDAPFSWSYRADSLDFPQDPIYTPTGAYARVERDGTLVPEESYNPLELHDDDVRVERTAAGSYTVTFLDMNPLDASLEPTLSPYSVLVQKTCTNDTAGGAEDDGCFRAVCVPSTWTPGDFETWDTTIEVRCFAADGSARDTGFRVSFGDEGFIEQGNWDGGYRYGWTDWSIAPDAEGCHEAPEVMSNSQHETPPTFFPGLPVTTCRTDVGTYQVNFFEENISIYSADGANVVVSSRETDGTYCNVGEILCSEFNGACGIPGTTPNARITVTCFDSSGNPADSRFTMNMTY